VTGVAVRDGDRVKSGALAVRLEAMKIEASLTFERDGVVAAVRVAPGEQVVAGQSLVVLHAADPDEHAPS
jgi:biotin carboxyl carrier protein